MFGNRELLVEGLIDETNETGRRFPTEAGLTELGIMRGVDLKHRRHGVYEAPKPEMRTGRLRIYLVVVAGLLASTAVMPASAGSTDSCGGIQTVKKGETLFKIAERAYGDGFLYDRIFAANRALLPDAGSLEIGDQILIPCLDGTGPATRDEASAQLRPEKPSLGQGSVPPAAQPSTAPKTGKRISSSALVADETRLAGQMLLPGHYIVELHTTNTVSPPLRKPPAQEGAAAAESGEARADFVAAPTLNTQTEDSVPFENLVQLVAGTGLAPFADPALIGGGMIADLVARAIRATDPVGRTELNFVNGGFAEMGRLLLDGSFDIGFPLYKPDCSRTEGLGEEMQLLCEQFVFSRPIVEAPIRFYTRIGNGLSDAADRSVFDGKKFCYPSDSTGYGLHALLLQQFNASSETTGSGAACLVRLIQGQVDVVALNWQEAEVLIRELGITGQVAETSNPTFSTTLHAIASKSKPAGRSYLQLLDRGLDQVMRSGEWFNIVAFHNAEHAQGMSRR